MSEPSFPYNYDYNQTSFHIHRMRATPQRLQLLEYLEKTRKPLSASALIEHFKKEVDTATIYRSLKAMTDAGILRRIDFQHGHAHYEPARRDHHHLICKKCGKVEDVTGCDFKEMQRSVLKKSKNFASVTQHSLEFFGLCKTCARDKRSS